MIYLDHNASTPIAPEVREAMAPYLTAHFGNPSTSHWAGKPAAEAVARARAEVAALLGARPSEIVFTSGGSESNNHAVKGTLLRAHLQGRRPHVVTSVVEHPSVLEPLALAERLGARVTRVAVDGHGRVDPEDVARAIERDTVLVSVMHAQNEVGTLQPIADIAAICRARGVRLHSDAAQSAGKLPVRVDDLGVDLLTVAGHKLYAPKGIGALFVRDGTELEPLIHGAGHEGGRRAGTENVPYVVALGAACELARRDPCEDRMRALRDHLHDRLSELGGVLFGHPSERLPNTLDVGFRGRLGPELLSRLEGVAASTGSACHYGSNSLSPVLQAMGVDPEVGLGAIRFSLGRHNTEAELDQVADRLAAILAP